MPPLVLRSEKNKGGGISLRGGGISLRNSGDRLNFNRLVVRNSRAQSDKNGEQKTEKSLPKLSFPRLVERASSVPFSPRIDLLGDKIALSGRASASRKSGRVMWANFPQLFSVLRALCPKKSHSIFFRICYISYHIRSHLVKSSELLSLPMVRPPPRLNLGRIRFTDS